MLIELKQRVSHYRWRLIVRRERRRQKRQAKAKERDKKLKEEQEALLLDPAYLEELEEYNRHEELAQRLEEEEAARRKEEWQLRDAALHSKFLREKERERLQEEARQRQEELIKKEWEEKQTKEKEEEEKKKEEQVWMKTNKNTWVSLSTQKALLEAATKGLGKDEEEPTHNPEPPANYHRRDFAPIEREVCPFFTKTGACRFGIHCSRDHSYPEISTTILIPNMYSHFGMEKVAFDEYDDDASLEYSERETYEHFREFYEDTLPEFKKCGSVMQFKVCCNASSHLRGNLYVQYSNETEAMKARNAFNGRWYAGRQLNCIFVDIPKWRAALCKLFQRNRKGCPKGGQCNFLHAFHNPGNSFWRADMDLPSQGPIQHTYTSPMRLNERRKEKGDWNRKQSHRSRSRSRTGSIRSNSRRSRSRSSDSSKRSDSHKFKRKNSKKADNHQSRSPYRRSDYGSRKHIRRGRSRSTSRSPSRSSDESEKDRLKYKSDHVSRKNTRSRRSSKSPKKHRSKTGLPEISKRSRVRSKSRSPKKRSKSKSPKVQGGKSKLPPKSESKSPYTSNKVNGSK